MEQNPFYKQLVDRYTSKKASDEELQVFFQLLKEGKLDEYLTESLHNVAAVDDIEELNEADPSKMLNPQIQPYRKLKTWMRLAVAACVLGLISIGVFYLYNNQRIAEKNEIVAQDSPVYPNDVPPGGNRAILTLADGSAITLDSAVNGEVAEQGNLKIIKLNDGQLEYRGPASSSASAAPSYNTLTTPRGGQYNVVLADGTKVWLNTASSLRFPAVFEGKERLVEVDGECYFEVAKNASMPFRVKMNKGVVVEVLGTHFNIHSYKEEPIRATLLEGAIKVHTQQESGVLKPGQEALIKNSGALNILDDVDLEQAVAWKNGLFHFNRADIATIMRQIERWYDVEVVYQGSVPEKEFVGKVSMNTNISEVLEILELSKIHFRIEGKKITVMP